MSCLDDATVLGLVEGRLAPELIARVDEHIDTCASCRDVVTLVAGTRSAPRVLARGDNIGRYVVGDLLGAGAMGRVYSAWEPELDRRVAIKVLHDQGSRERLVKEAQAMARLNHPNVVTVHEVGTVDRQIFIVMELNDGGTLRAWLAQEPRPPVRERIRVFIEAGRGLAAAHAVRLVHRDFKPDNVLMARDGRVRVVDFGLVRAPAAGDRPSRRPSRDVYAEMSLTMSGAVIGTPAYMAPEQHRAEVADHRSDQFSFCVSVYEALYGRRPFAGETYRELVVNILDGCVLPPPAGTEVSDRVHAVLARGLASAPDDRYPGMTALLDELAEAAAEVPEQATLASAPAPAPSLVAAPAPARPVAARRRRGLALALAGGLVVASAAVSVALALGLARSDDPPAAADAAVPAPLETSATVAFPVDAAPLATSPMDASVEAPRVGGEPSGKSSGRRARARDRKATTPAAVTGNPGADAAPSTESAAEKRRRTLELSD